jgi:hypothetical protein
MSKAPTTSWPRSGRHYEPARALHGCMAHRDRRSSAARRVAGIQPRVEPGVPGASPDPGGLKGRRRPSGTPTGCGRGVSGFGSPAFHAGLGSCDPSGRRWTYGPGSITRLARAQRNREALWTDCPGSSPHARGPTPPGISLSTSALRSRILLRDGATASGRSPRTLESRS